MKAAPATAVPLPLVSVIVSTLASPVAIEDGPNALATVSAPSTVSDAFAAVVLDPALPVVMKPIGNALA